MKKQKLKNYLRIGVLLFGVALILTNCQNESIEDATLENVKIRQVKYVSDSEIPEIINFLESNLGFTQGNTYSRTVNSQNSSVDIENALQVIDTLGNTNHSFLLSINDDNDATFYNLVVHESLENEFPNAYVYKYEVNQDQLQLFVDNNYSFSNFTGTVKRYSLEAFLDNTSSSTSSAQNRSFGGVDDCVCEETPIESGGFGGGGSTGSGYPPGGSPSGGSGGSGSITCSASAVVLPCNGGGNHDGSEPACVGSFQGSTVLRVSCSDGSVTDYDIFNRSAGPEDDCNNPCEDDTVGDVGILLPKPSPCEKMKELANDDTFKGYLSAMKTFATSTVPEANREIAYTRTNDGNYSDVFVGELGADRVDVAVPSPINIHMHTHQPQSLDPDSLPVYSASDLYNIYWLLDNDKITNFRDFALTLVTETTTYAIRIKSKTAFLTAFQNFFNITGDTDAELGIKFLENVMKEFGINSNESDVNNETNFVKMLENLSQNNGGTGLQLFKANTDYSNWSELATNKFGQVNPLDCE